MSELRLGNFLPREWHCEVPPSIDLFKRIIFTSEREFPFTYFICVCLFLFIFYILYNVSHVPKLVLYMQQ